MVFPLKFIQNLHDQSSLCYINLPTDKCCKQALVRRYRGMGKIGKTYKTQSLNREKGPKEVLCFVLLLTAFILRMDNLNPTQEFILL